MVSPKKLAEAAQLLFQLKDEKTLQEVIAGNQPIIKEILTPVAKGVVSNRDMDTFSSMVEACTRTATGNEKSSINPASLVRAMTGNGWTIALAAAGALVKNAGEIVAKITENKANALAEGFLLTGDMASDKQREFWGDTLRGKTRKAVANYELAKAANKAETVRGITRAISDAIGAGTGIYQMGKVMEAGREYPVGAEVLRTGRAAAKMLKGDN